MTTLERLAKLAYEKMIEQMYIGGPKATWEEQSRSLRDDWIASTRSVVEGMKDAPLMSIIERVISRYPVMKGGGGIMVEIWDAMIDTILEEKP